MLYSVIRDYTNMMMGENKMGMMYGGENSGSNFGSIIAFILILTLTVFIGKYLWNGSLVSLTTFVRPAHSAWQILGIMLLASIILPR